MKRTYRSKKDSGSALDHRDMLQNMDEKQNIFDAFYIQNLKQTKRELSCISSSINNAVASNKVRKRKYVKRIVKVVEPARQRETMESSAYLTPDKSIRVNKVLDPFDMLLNSSVSSPICQKVPKAVEDDVSKNILPKKESKTYTRKKLPKAKKCNYSSTDSNSTESDKENTSHSQSNVTDIRTHELLVEREPRSSPKYLDESINRIVNNLSLINNFKRKGSNGSFNTSYKSRNRLTINAQSPILQKSPLCSTPFKEKYRGVSIFKFSPISQKEQVISPNCVTILEDKDESNASTVFVGKDIGLKASKEYQTSPLTHLPNVSNEHRSDLSINEKGDHSNGSVSHNTHSTSQIQMEIVDNEIQNNSTTKPNMEQSSFLFEPFLGFSNKVTDDSTRNKISLVLNYLQDDDSIQENNIDSFEKESVTNKSNVDDTENISNISILSNKCNTSQSSIDAQSSDNESMYDTCNTEQSSSDDDYKDDREPIVVIERLSDSTLLKYYEKMQAEYEDEEMREHSDNDDFESLANDSNEEELLDNSMNTESDYVETKTNTIVITDSSTTEDVTSSNEEDADSNNEEERCVSFVTTRRRNEITDSMFIFDNSYGSSSTDCDKTVVSNARVNLDKSDISQSVDNICKHSLDELDTLEENYVAEAYKHEAISRADTRKSLILPRQSSTVSSAYVSCDSELPDSPCDGNISRITTRKCSRLPSRSHSSSPEVNTSKHEITPIDTNEAINKTVVEKDSIAADLNDLDRSDIKSPLVTKKCWAFDDSSIMNPTERSSYAGAEVKPAIVLQPGKKWERSLSIYRRMTMVADHFDQSILDDECKQKKGRKYRESVISTMERQEFRDSLHNDSIHSRRSTFISKSSRPTIRFVKDPNISRVSINTSSVFDDLKGFLNEECDDTVIELSKLSIADSEHEVTILDNFHETDRVATARDYVLRRCNQNEPILFDECYPETVLKNCYKIGEGVYGEVFNWRGRDGRARVMKIVPIAGNIKVNGEDQKDFHEIISEIVIAMELSALRAPIADFERQLDEGNEIDALDLQAVENATDTFNQVLAVRIVQGAYPARLLDLWELYDESRGSENESPAALPPRQHYLVLELAHAGADLESHAFVGAHQAHALFQQIAFGLAVAEESFQFEHRDLHWGNVLIAPTEQKLATFILRGRVYRVPRCGVAATLIDYSLSRITLPLAADSAALYNDLATDEQLFDAVGDYQFEVYRLMRDKLGNDWKNFEPYTNILWLHYTVDKMITALRYERTKTKIHKHYIEKLKGIKERILEYGSAVQYVLTDIEF